MIIIPAPTKPGVNLPRSSMSTSLDVLILLAVKSDSIFDLAAASGTGSEISFEKRPLTLGSMASVLLVAATSITILGNDVSCVVVFSLSVPLASLLVLSHKLLILSMLSHNCDTILKLSAMLVIVVLIVLLELTFYPFLAVMNPSSLQSHQFHR